MNITLTGNNDRQNDKDMAMVGQAPEGAKRYEVVVDIISGSWNIEQAHTLLVPCPFAYHHDGIFTAAIMAMSPDLARVHAAEVMASYLED